MANEESRGKDIGRTLRMLRTLMEGKRLDAQTASREFDINPEPALRNLKLLKELVPGVTQAQERQKYVFAFDPITAFGEEAIGKTRPSVASAIAVTLGAAFSRVFAGTQYRTDLERLRRQVVEQLAGAWKQHFVDLRRKFVVICGAEEILGDRDELLDDVVTAVLKQKLARMKYRNFSGEERSLYVKPYSLGVYDAHLYVIGSERADDGAFKTPHPFRFGRIREFEVLDQHFEYPQAAEYDPESLFGDSIGVWIGDPQPVRALIRLSPTWAVYARHHKWHRSQRIIRELDDGSVVLELLVRTCPEFDQWVLRFGEHAELLEPLDVRERIAERLREASARYSSPEPSE